MRYGSLCSGIEAASVGWCALGWEPAFFSEIDASCCRVLAAHYKDVENYGDITKVESVPAIDVLVAGTPCQSFSVNGLRKGLDDDRGNILRHFCRIVGSARPRWVIWENVPGVLTSNRGRDFGTLVGALGQFGYGWAYRVLDARYFGVAQRRRRVFVVGHYRDWRPPAAVLFDAPACSQHGPTPRKAQARPFGPIQGATASPLLGWTGDTTPKFGAEVVPTLRAYQGGEGVGVVSRETFRRLTLTEWERLQGFPDGYTAVDGVSDSERRTAIGNSFCVPIIRWIGERIKAVDE